MSKLNSLALRTITGVILAALVAGAFWLKLTFYLILLVALMVIYEMGRALYPKCGKLVWLSSALAVGMVALVAVFGQVALLPTAAVGMILLFAGGMLLGYTDLQDFLTGILGFLYPSFFMCFLLLMHKVGSYPILLLMLILNVALSSITDMGAYFMGMLLGKRKLCPNISPKKTIAGSVSGLVSSVVLALVIGWIAGKAGIHIHWVHYLIIGLMCGVLGQFGDLTASIIKRSVGIKDYASILPGMGGFMDRIDNIIFCSAPIYFYFTLLLGY